MLNILNRDAVMAASWRILELWATEEHNISLRSYPRPKIKAEWVLDWDPSEGKRFWSIGTINEC